MKTLAKFLLSVCDSIEFFFFSFTTLFQHLKQELNNSTCRAVVKETFIKTLILTVAFQMYSLAFNWLDYKVALVFMFYFIVAHKSYDSFYSSLYSSSCLYRRLGATHYSNGFFPLEDVYVVFENETIKRVTLVAFTLIVGSLIALPVLLVPGNQEGSAISLTVAALISNLLYCWFTYFMSKLTGTLKVYELE